MTIRLTALAAALGLASQPFAALPLAAQEAASAAFVDPQGRPAGTATLTQTPAGLLIAVEAENLPPGAHGFHIHETGACQPDFEAAGDHFAPQGNEHGFAATETPHVADLPNLHVGEDGRAAAEFLNARATLAGGEDALLDDDGAALVIHADPDDYRDVDSAGDRIACAVVAAGG